MERALVNNCLCNNCMVVFVGLPLIGVNVAWRKVNDEGAAMEARWGQDQPEEQVGTGYQVV